MFLYNYCLIMKNMFDIKKKKTYTQLIVIVTRNFMVNHFYKSEKFRICAKIFFILLGISCICGMFVWDRNLFTLPIQGVFSIISDIFISIMIILSVTAICFWIDGKKEDRALHTQINGKLYQWLPYIFVGIAIILRVVQFGLLPKAMMCDEQSMLYDAWSLGKYGKDRNGYKWPVYLEAWGSGQSALLAYLTIPFVKLFGMNVYAARTAMLITSLLAVVVFYLLMRKISNKNVALIALFLFAISPFHIMMSRWGLDCNLFINFLIFALFFLVKSFEENKHWYFVLASFLFGLCLYAYALSYLVLVLLLIMVYVYMLCFKKIKWMPFIIGNIILGVMALPLFLFILVNQGWIQPILSFISIPKLSAYRGDEIGLSFGSLYHIVTFLFELDSDFRAAAGIFGSLYHIGTIFFVIGVISMFSYSIRKMKQKEFDPSIIILMLFVSSMLEAIVIKMNFYKWNQMFICYYAMVAIGMEKVMKQSYKICVALFYMLLVSCVLFMVHYGTYYNHYSTILYDSGLIEAVQYLENNKKGQDVEVYSSWEGGINTLMVLKLSPDEISQSVEYDLNKYNWRKITRLKNYHYYSLCQNDLCSTMTINPTDDKIYVVKDGTCGACHTRLNLEGVFDETWQSQRFNDFIVYYK